MGSPPMTKIVPLVLLVVVGVAAYVAQSHASLAQARERENSILRLKLKANEDRTRDLEAREKTHNARRNQHEDHLKKLEAQLRGVELASRRVTDAAVATAQKEATLAVEAAQKEAKLAVEAAQNEAKLAVEKARQEASRKDTAAAAQQKAAPAPASGAVAPAPQAAEGGEVKGASGSKAAGPLFGRVPKVIVQTGEQGAHTAKGTPVWAAKNPGFKLEYYGERDRAAFLKEQYGDRVATAYETLNAGAFKADLFRVAYLYKKGGVYADMDLVPMVGLDDLLQADVDYVSIAERADFDIPGVLNGFQAAVPALPFLKRAVDLIVMHTETRWLPPNTDNNDWKGMLNISGPVNLAHALGGVHTNGRHVVEGHPVFLWQSSRGQKITDPQNEGRMVIRHAEESQYTSGKPHYTSFYPQNVYKKLRLRLRR
eukprot:g7484.t1